MHRIVHGLLSAFYILSICFLSSCALLFNSADTKSYGVWQTTSEQRIWMQDSNGRQKKRVLPPNTPVLLYAVNDTLCVHLPSEAASTRYVVHNEEHLRTQGILYDSVRFRDAHFDVDLITVPLRYRFRQGTTIPPNMVASPFSAGVYAGWRTDAALHHIQLLSGQTLSTFETFGFGLGGFVSLAPVYVSPWNTDYRSMVEYDGAGLSYGAACIVAYQKVTLGVLVGFELLLDENSAVWVYHNKPWIGVSLGFNLN